MKKSLEIRRLDIYDAVGVYTIQFLDKAETEFMDFMSKYKDIADPILKEDFNRIYICSSWNSRRVAKL